MATIHEFTYDGRDVRVHDLLPIVLKPIQDFQSLSDNYGVELESLYKGLTKIFDDNFIESASGETLAKWELWLGVIPNATDTLDERRFRILLKLNDAPPYTDRYLVAKLDELCPNNYRIIRDYQNYKLAVELSMDSIVNTETLQKLIREIIPANLELTVGAYAARHYELAVYTHAELAEFTQQGVKTNEMLEQ